MWLDRNRDGIQDEDEHGVQGVLVKLRCPSVTYDVDATKTGSDGEFQFVLDEEDFDADPYGGKEFFIQIYAPKGFENSPTATVEEPKIQDRTDSDGERSGMSPLFSVFLGEMYTVDAGLVTSCDPSLGFISFDGIAMAAAFEPGSITIEWDPASLSSYDKTNPLRCGNDLLLYDVYLANYPFDFSSFSGTELLYQASYLDSVRHIETGEHFVIVDDLEPNDILSALVVAKVPGLVSENRGTTVINVDDGMEFDDNISGEEALSQYYEKTDNLRGARQLRPEVSGSIRAVLLSRFSQIRT